MRSKGLAKILNKTVLLELYSSGLTEKDISIKFGVDEAAIRYWFRKFGITGRDRRYKTVEFELETNRTLGYFCGLVLGDGSLYATKSHNYGITLSTTKIEFADLFAQASKELSPKINPLRSSRLHTRTFPNGTISTDLEYSVRINSKILFNMLRPFKMEDFHWKIPIFLTTIESIEGFLAGIFDAEGGVNNSRPAGRSYIQCYSKHRDNLEQISQELTKLKIKNAITTSKITQKSTLRIWNKSSKIIFQRKIGFKLQRKAEKLMQSINSYNISKF